MIWKVIHWSASFLCWVALTLLIANRVPNRRTATVRANGNVEFAPSWFGMWLLIYVAIWMGFITWGYLRHGMVEPLRFAIGILLGLTSAGLVSVLPGSVLVTDSGLEQVFWLWRNKRIRWEEIVVINTERKGSAVTIIGADKTRIVHSSQLPDRPRFLLEIRQHCGDNLPADFLDGDENKISSK